MRPERAALFAVIALAMTIPAEGQEATPEPTTPELGGPVEDFTEFGELNLTLEDGTELALPYAAVDGYAIYEGDIELGTAAEIALLDLFGLPEEADPAAPVDPALEEADLDGLRGNVINIAYTGSNVLWPNGVVPYVIDANHPRDADIRAAIQHWMDRTSIEFVARDAGNPDHRNYIRFIDPGDPGTCRSPVGMQGGEQIVRLGAYCTQGPAIHEIGHSLGLAHEQSRSDRNNFIVPDEANMTDLAKYNFGISGQNRVTNCAYDLASIMHYPQYVPLGFAIDPNKPIFTLAAGVSAPRGVAIGQRSQLSQGDVDAIERLYDNDPACS